MVVLNIQLLTPLSRIVSCDFRAIYYYFGELTPTQVKLKRDFTTGVGKKDRLNTNLSLWIKFW